MNIQPISTCTQNCRILRTTFSVADALHWYTSSNSSCYHVIWYLFWCETPPSSSGKWRSSSGLLMGYPKGFASQDSYVTKLHRYTKNYPFMMLVSSKSTHVVSVRHSPAGNPGSPGRLKKRSSKPLESWIKDDSNRFKHYTSYKPLSSIHSQQPNFPLNLWGFRFRFRIMKSCPAPQYFPLKYIGMTWHDNLVDLNSLTWCGEELDLPNWSPKSPFNVQLGWMNSVEASVHKLDQRVRSTTWEFSANPPIGSIYQLYTTYILPFGSFWGVICYLDTTF